MAETILLPGTRDARATLDSVEHSREGGVNAVVVACPPHPKHRGHRGDERLVAVSDALGENGIDCLRFDYGPWDGGRGERADATNAVRWARQRYDRVGAFGFSFGGAIALLAAAEHDRVAAASALAPAGQLAVDGHDATWALDHLDIPVQVVYGARDDTADWRPVVERARERGHETVELSADHFFVGQAPKAARRVSEFLRQHLD